VLIGQHVTDMASAGDSRSLRTVADGVGPHRRCQRPSRAPLSSRSAGRSIQAMEI
jgi:hypothetical protein